jgi:hypothetical protein
MMKPPEKRLGMWSWEYPKYPIYWEWGNGASGCVEEDEEMRQRGNETTKKGWSEFVVRGGDS